MYIYIYIHMYIDASHILQSRFERSGIEYDAGTWHEERIVKFIDCATSHLSEDFCQLSTRLAVHKISLIGFQRTMPWRHQTCVGNIFGEGPASVMLHATPHMRGELKWSPNTTVATLSKASRSDPCKGPLIPLPYITHL